MNLVTPQQFKRLFPLACSWAEEQETYILQNGTPLSESQINDAILVPVTFPEKVRLLKVHQVPWPENHELLLVGQKAGLISDFTCGRTLGHGIFIRSDYWQKRRLIIHELAHVAQYERLGGIRQFLEQYLQECLTVGYKNAPMEKEAKETARRICGK
ncbi:hypothetical protein ES703_63333 [subsurface metagenome]